MTRKRNNIRFTDEERTIIGRAAYQVWQEIGHDIVEANDGKEPSKAVVVEVVLDADRLMNKLRWEWGARGIGSEELLEKVRTSLYGNDKMAPSYRVERIVYDAIFGGKR